MLAGISLGQQPGIEVSGFDCGDCHGATGWNVLEFSGFSHQSTGFPLEGAHRAQPCYQCHQGVTLIEKHQFQTANTECTSCHLDIHQSTLGEECTFCHEFTSWQVTQKTFNHETTRFPLQGAHRSIACDECHTEKPMTKFNFVDTDCFACHKSDYDRALEPSHVLARFNRDCQICHSDRRPGWRPSLFSHADTDFPLTGVHMVTECADCHLEGQFKGTPITCQDAICHLDDFNTTTAPNHLTYDYPEEYCEECHVTLGWTPSDYEHTIDFACSSCHIPDFQQALNPVHNVENGFTIQCEDCHDGVETWAGAQFDHAGVQDGTCASCHISNYNATTNPNHTTFGFTTNCSLCHGSTQSWTYNVSYDHSQNNSPPCADCHLSDYYGTSTSANPDTPDHQGLGLSTDCTICHGIPPTATWTDVTFSHSSVSAIPCADCHLNQYINTTDPDHSANNFSTDCELCHGSTVAWRTDVSFDHSLIVNNSPPCVDCHLPEYNNLPNSTYPNAPDHADLGLTTDCTVCHNSTADWTDVTFSHASVSSLLCADCHLNQYNNTTDPDHAASGFTIDCTQCHTSTTDWTAVTFDHNLVTVPCSDCHMPDYNNTVNSTNPDVPNHVDSGFTTDCTQCHASTSDWTDVNFDHASVTVPCADCHMPDYNNLPNTTYPNAPNHADLGLSTDCSICHNSTSDWTDVTFSHASVSAIPCADCHLNQYNNTTDPNHSVSGFSTECTLCHGSTNSWTENVTFDHTNISQLCTDCHLEDYNSATNPNHISQQYPTTCEDCHSTDAWTPATFDHDGAWFPIYSGKHDNEWSTCTAECHINPADYDVFSCGLNGVCHDHDRTSMDSEHLGEVSGYVYESNACYDCHPNGTEGDDGGDDIRGWRRTVKRIRK
ncbi:MAG: hypothetical protein GXO90_09110 [FCB group bacterium]|nr:hypothetical protein [FCB group bacterium]